MEFQMYFRIFVLFQMLQFNHDEAMCTYKNGIFPQSVD